MVMVLLHHRFFHIILIFYGYTDQYSLANESNNSKRTYLQFNRGCKHASSKPSIKINQQDAPTISQILTACQLHTISNNCFRSTTSTSSYVNKHEINWQNTIPFTKRTCSSHNILYMTLFLLTTCSPVPLHNN